MPDTQPLVVCVDVGSIANRRFAWAAATREDGHEIAEAVRHVSASLEGGHDITETARRVSEALWGGRRVALGFECPGWIPVRDEPAELGRSRPGEGRHPWSGGPGATVLATGIAQISWMLRAVANDRPSTKATTQIESWDQGRPLLLWEAFVAGERKPDAEDPDIGDACAGVQAFMKKTTLEPDAPTGTAVNLLSVLASWAGLDIVADEHKLPFSVYAPPAPGT